MWSTTKTSSATTSPYSRWMYSPVGRRTWPSIPISFSPAPRLIHLFSTIYYPFHTFFFLTNLHPDFFLSPFDPIQSPLTTLSNVALACIPPISRRITVMPLWLTPISTYILTQCCPHTLCLTSPLTLLLNVALPPVPHHPMHQDGLLSCLCGVLRVCVHADTQTHHILHCSPRYSNTLIPCPSHIKTDYCHAFVAYFECAFTQIHKPIIFSTAPQGTVTPLSLVPHISRRITVMPLWPISSVRSRKYTNPSYSPLLPKVH